MNTGSKKLLLEITQCPNVAYCFENTRASHPCRKVISAQNMVRTLGEFHVPEPWSGDIDKAPILFLSSNPSVDEAEEFPVAGWSVDRIADFFTYRFGSGGRINGPAPVDDRMRVLLKSGDRGRWVRFYAGVRRRAQELLLREPVPGVDYALTEIVHCKSRAEEGVSEAIRTCETRWLERVIRLSPARVLVVLGEQAGSVIRHRYSIDRELTTAWDVAVAGLKRNVTFLPAPNARKVRSFAKVSPSDIPRLRASLRSR